MNVALAWALLAFVLLVLAENVADGDLLWALFAGTVAAVALLPAAAFRDYRVMLPWEVLLLAVLPLLGRSVGAIPTFGQLGAYLSVAALALLVAVELAAFTSVEMTYWFAVLFVVVTTLATAGVWALVRWGADLYLGTGFDLEEHALMLEFVASTGAGVLAGVVFELYFRRRARVADRLPVSDSGSGGGSA